MEGQQNNARMNWREMLAAGLYQTGALRVLQKLSRFYELKFSRKHILPQWRKVSGAKFVVLCYHRVGTEGIPYYSSLAPGAFVAQMCFLRKHYRIVSLEQLCHAMENPDATGQAVAVTFDDGYRDVYTQAFPILEKYAIPATVFLTVRSIETGEVAWYDRMFLALQVWPQETLELELDRPRRFELHSPAARVRAATEIVLWLRKLPDERRRQACVSLEKRVQLPANALADRMLTWEQVRKMHQAGIHFGSHTMTHPVISRLPAVDVEREVHESKRLLEERIDGPVEDFAYPFGQPADCGTDATAVIARCGYRSAATTSWGINTPGGDRYRLRRVQIGEDASLAMFAFQLKQLFFRVEEDKTAANARTASRATEEAALCSPGPLGSKG